MSLLPARQGRDREKRVCLAIGDPDFSAVLKALLEAWDYSVVREADGETLVLVEDGCPAPAEAAGEIRISRSGYRGRDQLPQPLTVEVLWATLEPRFHRPPRSHIRVPLDLPAMVGARGRREATRLTSLSDLGTRFRLSRELATQEPLELDLEIEGASYHLQGEVIYVVPRGDAAGTAESEIGMLFVHPRPETRTRLREYIVHCYLEQVAARLPGESFRRGLAHFALPPRLQEAFAADPLPPL